MQKRILTPLVATALSTLAFPQSFDLILPTTIRVQPAITSTTVGILVNTGTGDLTLDAWKAGYRFVKSTVPLDGINLGPNTSASFNTIAPGDAAGDGNAAMLALLNPGENLTSGSEGPLDVLLGGTDGVTATLTGHVQFGDERLTYTVTVEVDQSVSGMEFVGAQRVSSVPTPLPFGSAAAACPIEGGQIIELATANGFGVGPYTVSPFSDLPYIGNPYFTVAIKEPLPGAYAGGRLGHDRLAPAASAPAGGLRGGRHRPAVVRGPGGGQGRHPGGGPFGADPHRP